MSKINTAVEIAGRTYPVDAMWGPLTVADSFVSIPNKLGRGKGEAKLYLGVDGTALRRFFGRRGFKAQCLVSKSNLKQTLEALRAEYESPSQGYRGSQQLPNRWKRLYEEVTKLPGDLIYFDLRDQASLKPPRVFAKSRERVFELVREICLSGTCQIRFLRVKVSSESVILLSLHVDLLPIAPRMVLRDIRDLVADSDLRPTVRERLIQARLGQGKFREDLFDTHAHCVVSGISFPPLLVASHIKPWRECSNEERLDPQNGLLLCANVDRLFDGGYISFEPSSCRLRVSPELPSSEHAALGLCDGAVVAGLDKLMSHRRSVYLAHHQKHHFRS